MKKLPLAAARRLFDGQVITMLVCAVLFTLSNNFLLGCAVILLGLAATAFHFAVLRCPTAASIWGGSGVISVPTAASC